MFLRRCTLSLLIIRCVCVVLLGILVAWSAMAAAPVKINSDIATPVDLTAEIDALLTTIQESALSPESYAEKQQQLKRQSLQIAVFAQSLAEHEVESPLKKSAPSLRNASLALARASAYDEAIQALTRMREAMEGKLSGTPAVEIEWSKLARTSTIMPILKERSEAIRRSLRRPKDADVESRNAMAIAILALATHGDLHLAKTPIDRTLWQEACLDLQTNMSRAATAIKTRDSAAADHFRLGMEACDKCHQKFKP